MDAEWRGLAAAAAAVLFFGSNYLPVRTLDVGDGFFFQWALCSGIWLVGCAVDFSESPPPQPLAALGGAAWATGHLAVPFVVQTIGMAQGLLLWGSAAMLTGWACGMCGVLGVASQAAAVTSWPLHLAGLALSLGSLAASLLLAPEPHPLAQPLLAADARGGGRRRAAVSLALFAGLCFGVNFNGAQYVIDRAGTEAYPHASTRSDIRPAAPPPSGDAWRESVCAPPATADSTTCPRSSAASSSRRRSTSSSTREAITPSDHSSPLPSPHPLISFGRHCPSAMWGRCYTGNRPDIRPAVALPAIASGVMWGVADALWFVANEELGFIVAFPIILSGPTIVASLWGIFFLGELKGRRNKAVAALVAMLVILGATLISLSRVVG